ncbi:hypothetical protein N7457_003568 [Penicillium paradoxum]|uniref:uncharacterized protein n=1 Tax=Penicillium paradoxum TaxID=176176 RepID=UPI002547E1C8|nr:uncharacterized protein N7457_003568 [Penicillium paradoxum]KAJ5788578.1 hypothetical protein N7457_003568 [Penicillium paradoxum]
MSTTSIEQPKSFAAAVLPRYHGPLVKIRIQPSDREYTISKSLLCAKSQVFSTMFNSNFLESKTQTATIEEMEGVISVRSLEALFQWLYLGIIKFEIDSNHHEEHISAAIELARLADKYDITGLGVATVRYIKKQLSASVSGYHTHLTPEHNISGLLLPQGHTLRRVLAAACISNFLRPADHKFKKETEDYPTFAADLLKEVKTALDRSSKCDIHLEDPISGRSTYVLKDL